jgi:ribonuclease P/MRP protein subunit POP3
VISKGKRSQKRKRQEAKEKALLNGNDDTHDGPPLPPEIQKHVVVGLNSILRHLQSLSQASKSKQRDAHAETILETPEHAPEPGNKDPNDLAKPQPFAAIFALSPTPANPTVLTTHLPTLVHTSSLLYSSLPPTRLIPLSQVQALQLKTILSLARTSHMGILDSAPGAEALIAVIRENVPVVEARWMDEVKKGVYLETRINAIETFVGVSRKEMREKMQRGEGEEG